MFHRDRVYLLLQRVPKGRVVTYGSLAVMLGNKKWARAVGNALHKNPDGALYPCYKVVGADGALSRAYAFGGLAAQKQRLEAEGIEVSGDRVSLKCYEWKPDADACIFLDLVIE